MDNVIEQFMPDSDLTNRVDSLEKRVGNIPRPIGRRFSSSLCSNNFQSGGQGWQIKDNGDVEFNNGVFRGNISATTIDIGGSDTSSFHVDIDGNLWLGAALFANAPAKITNAGAATFSNITVNGRTFTSDPTWGDGSDGDVTISGATTLTADKFYNNLIINGSQVLNPGGFRIFVKDTLTINGSISRNGTNGNNGSGTTGGAAVTAPAAGSIPGGTDGGRGADASQTNNTTGTNATKCIGGAGGAGGNGGSSGGTFPGSAGKAGGSQTGTAYNIPKSFQSAYLLLDTQPTVSTLNGSTGGGGGGGGATQSPSSAGGGGGGGSSGGIIEIFARRIVNNGTITVTGGNGGNGAAGSGANGGGGGGGGAGGGGVIIMIYETLTGSGTISAAGGTKGTGGAAGGANSSAGADGVDGTDGSIIQLPVI